MSEHTAGPWRISSRPAQLVSTDGHVIALVIGYDSENLQENARLISAAPDLLAACKLAVGELDNAYQRKAREVIEEAISKAEGRNP